MGGPVVGNPLTTATPLTVRHRQSGDRITLKPGFTKKLSRVFIDQKCQMKRERVLGSLRMSKRKSFGYQNLQIPI